jgi:hypothetical protein
VFEKDCTAGGFAKEAPADLAVAETMLRALCGDGATHVRFRTDNFCPPRGTKRLADRCCVRRLVATPHTCGKEPGGKRRCQSPSVAAPFHNLLRGTLTALVSRGGRGEVRTRRCLPLFSSVERGTNDGKLCVKNFSDSDANGDARDSTSKEK